MRIGQTSFIVFVSKLVGSFLGFVATIYFARVLGAEILGYYAAVMAILSWVKFGSKGGFLAATKKRLSEEHEQGAYLSAGLITICTATTIAAGVVYLFREQINAYVGENVALLIIMLIFVVMAYNIIQSVLQGQRDVHIAGILKPVKIGLQSISQIALVFIGMGLTGMLAGYAIGGILFFFIGLFFVSVPLRRPAASHFRSLFDYAKYAWLSKLESRSFNDVDIVILTALVSPFFVGIYSVAWTLATFLTTFGSAIRKTLFPEISYRSAAKETDEIAQLVTDSISYGGLIVIPGLIGGIVLSERLMLMYGPEFVEGAAVLWILILAVLFRSYHKQLTNGLNGIDRPDISFRVNALVIVLNVVLNVVFILNYGMIGAAIATTLAAFMGAGLAFYALQRQVPFTLPTDQISRQMGAAVMMGIVVYVANSTIRVIGIQADNLIILAILVPFGAGVYFSTLVALSKEFRSVVIKNMPKQFQTVFPDP